jgi:Right handed beta helix region
MSNLRFKVLSSAASAVVVAGGSLAAAAPVSAQPLSSHWSHTVFVSPDAPATQSGKRGGHSCANAQFSSIQDAIEGVSLGGTVVVCKGTYPGLVTIDRRVDLVGRHGATIDATGMIYGVGTTASHVTIAGLKVINASDTTNGPADGILTAGLGATGPVVADHVRILHNVVTGNLGSGIDVNSTSHSVAIGNVANENGVGINVADDLGAPALHNVIKSNITNKNFGGCGIALADHSGLGVSDTLVAHNIANNNGLGTATRPDASAGSGVILASPAPNAIVTDNKIIGNVFTGNGHGGVVVHAHVPGGDFSGNVVSHNWIGKNNVRTDTSDLKTTGIYLGTASPLSIVVNHNSINHDHFGIFTAGDVTVVGHNAYHDVKVHVAGVATY